MRDIMEIDKNLKVNTNIEKPDIRFYDGKDNIFSLHGLLLENGFRRLPARVAENTNDGVKYLHTNTAGGRIRFVTDSEYIALSCKMPSVTRFPHMPLTGTTGFDLYVNNVYQGIFTPPVDTEDGFEGIVELGSREKREIMIGFPLYNDVSELYLGLQEDAEIEKAPAYQYIKPVVFYGSSITQGGCVSRAGISYPAILSREIDCDYVNLGFSGSARGEQAIAEYIAGLSMSVFVLDYDHNAPDKEHLEKTHEPFFRIVREKCPDLPIIMISRPDYRFTGLDGEKRRTVIRRTYENAKADGDKKVWFIDGEALWGDLGWDSCTMDRCHPNDLGHWRMAETIAPVLREALAAKSR